MSQHVLITAGAAGTGLEVASGLIPPRVASPLAPAPHPAIATAVALATLSPQTGEGVLEFDRIVNFAATKEH